MAIELAQGLSRFFRRDYKPALEDAKTELLPEHAGEASPTLEFSNEAEKLSPETIPQAEVADESVLTEQVKEILDRMLAENSSEQIPVEFAQKNEGTEQANEQTHKKIEGWDLVSATMKESLSSDLARADFDGNVDTFQKERMKAQEPSMEDLFQVTQVSDLIAKNELTNDEMVKLEKSASDSGEKLSRLIQAKLDTQKEIENQKREITELRGNLSNESLSKEKQLSEKVEKSQELQFAKGAEVVNLLKEKKSEIDAQVLQQATERMKEAIRAEKESWKNLAQIRDSLIQRYPEQQDIVSQTYDNMVQEMKLRKEGINVPPKMPELSEEDKSSKYSWSRFSLENIANKSESKDPTVLGSLYVKMGVDEDGVFANDSILREAIATEKQLRMISERMEPSLRKAEADPQIAEKLLLLMQARFQAEARLRELEPKIDDIIRTANSEMTNVSTETGTQEKAVNLEEEEEEESSSTSIATPDLSSSAGEVATPVAESKQEQMNPAIAEAQEELKRLEQRRMELQQLLSRSLPPVSQD